MSEKLKVTDWRSAIYKSSELKGPTKLVLYTLSMHMNSLGENCYPSVETIAKHAGLGKTATIDHLKLAHQHGFIRSKLHGFGGQGWARNEYVATFPPGCELDHNFGESSECQKGGSPNGLPCGEGGSPDVLRNCEGGSPGDEKAVRQTDSNKLEELDKSNTPISPAGEKKAKPATPSKRKASAPEEDSPVLVAFIQAYPNPSGRGRAKKKVIKAALDKALEKTTFDIIMAGVAVYSQTDDVRRGYEANAAVWLNQERWTDEPPAAPTSEKKMGGSSWYTPMPSAAGG